MKYSFSLIVILFFSAFSVANGQGGCGTVSPANKIFYTSEAERLNMVNPAPSRAGVRNVPVLYHIVAKTNGTGGASLKTVFDTHCELNAGFVQPQMYFYIFGIDTINNDALWAMSDGQGGTNYSSGYSAFSTYNQSGVVNVYITGALPGLCGFATFPNTAPNGGGLFLNVACCGKDGQTIPHEMGHYFNLDHTFRQTNPVEYVRRGTGSNCTTKGDGFCDTPADPSENRATCPYNDTQTDPLGDLYHPDETLFMSYFNDNCLNKFSPQQQNEMNGALSGPRSNLLAHTPPDLSPLDSAKFISPVNGDSSSLASSINFKWHSVSGAQYYYFRLQPATSSVVLIDTVVTDTFFNTNGLQANKGYKYLVRPISFGNVCDAVSSYQYIQTSIIKATVNVIKPNCPGNTNGVIGVSASNGVPPYTFNWSNGQTSNTISNLAPGIYTVTITDNIGRIATVSIEVNDPMPITISIDQVGFNLNAYSNGGTPPYAYSWNNGVTGQFNNNVPLGNYSVTVTDSKGCSAEQSFVISSNGINLETKVEMKLFPNPASKVLSLNLQLTLNESTAATITFMNINGETLQQFKKEFIAGVNNTDIDIATIPSGVYLVQFRSEKTIKTERISVIQ